MCLGFLGLRAHYFMPIQFGVFRGSVKHLGREKPHVLGTKTC